MLKHQAAAAAAAAKAAKAAKAGKVAKTQTAFQTAAKAAANQAEHYFFSMHDSTPTPAPAPTPTPTSTPTPTPTPALTSTPTPTSYKVLDSAESKANVVASLFLFLHIACCKNSIKQKPAFVYLPKIIILKNLYKKLKKNDPT